MGKIKKILENELAGGTQSIDVYPVTSIKAIYDESNERLDNIIRRKGIVNISTNYNSSHIAELFTLATAVAKVPSEDRVLGFQGKYLAFNGWHTIIYIGDSLTDWEDTTKWIDLADKVFNSISKNATFAGIATPNTSPGTLYGPVFWIASEPGIYINFGNTEIDNTGIFTWDGTSWSFEKLNIDAYTKAESDAMLATKQNVLTAGNGITIADDVISLEDKKFTVWSNPRIDEYVTTFENFGYNDDGTQKTSGSSVRSWVFKIGNYGHKKVYFSYMNAWMCDGLDDAQNMINPTLLGKESGNVDIGEEHIGKYIVAMSVSDYANYLGTPYGRLAQFCDEKTQAELDADERMLSDMYAGNLMRYAVAKSAIDDIPTLEWGNGAYLYNGNMRNIFLDIVSRPNIAYECKVAKNLNYTYQGCGRLREITPLWDTSLVTMMKSAFQMCRSLKYADLSHLNLSSVTDVSCLFESCIALIDANLPSLPVVTSCGSMFSNCASLQNMTLPSLPSVTVCRFMFSGCSSLQSVTLPELPSVKDCTRMFHYCTSLQSVTLPELPSVNNCLQMFNNCTSLQNMTLPSLPSVTDCGYMFRYCTSLQSLYLNMPNCENFSYSFYGCGALHTVEIVNVRKATQLENAFGYCTSLQNVTCVEELPKCNISFGQSSKLTLESVTNIITHLPDLSAEDSKTLTLNSTTKKLLTEALIAEATNKNWIIA